MLLTNSYLDLGEEFYSKATPKAVTAPSLFLWNAELADELGIPEDLQNDKALLAEYFSGNTLFPDSTPIALAYAGHQFGHFSPSLGDGRAHLLGELTLPKSGKCVDIQLKGSGPTVFSRRGDGRCALGPAVREYIMAEAMHALGIPTTRALAVVSSGEQVVRDGVRPGAIVTRIADSHIRVGTFEYFAARGNLQAVKQLCHFAIDRHYPELNSQRDENRFSGFLQAVMQKQINLICHWMRVGFIHGVMNTDNTAISGETIDYGPCAMMNAYNPKTVFSSIDTSGRYAFGQQAPIARWNMTRFAECLLPLINPDTDKAKAVAQELLDEFSETFHQQYYAMMGRKIGLSTITEADEKLIDDLLTLLHDQALDYTQSFNFLTNSRQSSSNAEDTIAFGEWWNRWQTRLKEQGQTDSEVYSTMRSENPTVIPRNHHMETVLEQCLWDKSITGAETFLDVLKVPYQETQQTRHFQDAPADGDRHYQTFCGT